jgi:hypothetical protein
VFLRTKKGELFLNHIPSTVEANGTLSPTNVAILTNRSSGGEITARYVPACYDGSLGSFAHPGFQGCFQLTLPRHNPVGTTWSPTIPLSLRRQISEIPMGTIVLL